MLSFCDNMWSISNLCSELYLIQEQDTNSERRTFSFFLPAAPYPRQVGYSTVIMPFSQSFFSPCTMQKIFKDS